MPKSSVTGFILQYRHKRHHAKCLTQLLNLAVEVLYCTVALQCAVGYVQRIKVRCFNITSENSTW